MTVAVVGVPCRRSRASLIATTALSTTPTQHEAVIGTVNRTSMWELRRRRVHSSEPSSACARQITRHGFKVPRARSEPFPKAAESGRKIKFLTVNGGFEPYQHLVSI